ncbi:MAG: cation:proton antiporter [Proteobacteria bacterium]|nr:cation:proton antiporter [Pseudomonadota bacterium]
MSLTNSQTANILIALALLLVAAHGLGHLFAHYRQPRVIGEILSGLLLGPTCFGYLLPELQSMTFPSSDQVTFPVLGAVYQLGLLLLMFCSGVEVRSGLQPGERCTAVSITIAGTLIPFGLGLLFLELYQWTGFDVLDLRRFFGEANNGTAFLLVFAVAVAVTSIPVISRIMFDLGILETSFARIVLGAAVIEDILLYIVLAIAIGMVGGNSGEVAGLERMLGIDPLSGYAKLYHLVAPLALIGISLLLGPRLFQGIARFRYNILAKSSPIAFLLVFMLTMTGLCIFLGVTPMFGAFVAGMVVGARSDHWKSSPREAIKSFAFAFFIPVYFAIVGLKLDLIHAFEPLFFIIFLVFACGAKSLSVYAGACWAGERKQAAWNLAVAMNARGGPGIVLASVAYDAKVIGESFYVTLVLLAIVTSLLAGSWLERLVARGKPLR